MSTMDDTEIFPADESGDAPSPNGRAAHGPPTASVLRREKDHPAAATSPSVPPRFLTALLRALSVWPT